MLKAGNMAWSLAQGERTDPGLLFPGTEFGWISTTVQLLVFACFLTDRCLEGAIFGEWGKSYAGREGIGAVPNFCVDDVGYVLCAATSENLRGPQGFAEAKETRVVTRAEDTQDITK